MANRAIQQGATARGLGTSGVRDLSLLQSQLAQGQGINQIQQQSEQTNRAALATRLGLQEQLGAQNMSAQTQYMANMINSDKDALEAQDRKSSQLMDLYRLAIESGGEANINDIAALLNIDLDSLTEAQKSALGGAVPNPYGDLDIRNSNSLKNIITRSLGGVSSLVNRNPLLGSALTAAWGTPPVTFKTPTGDKTFKNWTEAVDSIQKDYTEKLPDYEKAGVKAVKKGGRIVFDLNGTKYNTANEAIAAWKKYDSKG
jgi:hypothetical protein